MIGCELKKCLNFNGCCKSYVNIHLDRFFLDGQCFDQIKETTRKEAIAHMLTFTTNECALLFDLSVCKIKGCKC